MASETRTRWGMRSSVRWGVPALAAVLCAAPAAGQKALVASLLYEGPSLVAPAVLFVSSGPDGRAWNVGVVGWTVSGEWSRRRTPGRTLLVSGSLTPLNANGSDRMFRAGIRVPELEYRNASATAGVGLRLHTAPGWTSDVRVVGRHERITGLPAATVERWRQPYVGLEVAQTYERVSAEDPLRSHMEGIRVQGRVQAFGGSTPWGRLVASMDAGGALGPLLVRGHVSYLVGHELDVVNAFLVGGSWDAPGLHALYGHPYAAFRIERGTLLRGAVDVPVAGEWRLGLRAAHLAGPGGDHSGAMIRVGGSLAGVSAYLGAAAPDLRRLGAGGTDRVLLVGGLSAALLPE